MTKRFAYFLLLLLAVAVNVFGGPSSVVVEIRGDSVVSNDIVLVGDIADIAGESAEADKIRMASLGYAPRVGAVRTIPVRKIKLVIAATGVPQNAISFRSPPVAYVRREGQPVPLDIVRQKIEESLNDLISEETAEVRITQLDIPEPPEVPLGSIEVSVQFAKIRNLFEPFSLPVDIRVDGVIVSKFAARIQIEAFADVLTAKEDIAANTRISTEMLFPQRQRILRPLTEYLLDPLKVRGIKSSQEIRKGDPLTKSVFLADIVIRTGDRVRITGLLGRMRLVVNGVAQSSGRIGDRISVKNLQSDRIIQAIIADEGIVEVFF